MIEASPAKMRYEWDMVGTFPTETINGYELLSRLSGNRNKTNMLNDLNHFKEVKSDYAIIRRIF